MGKIILPEEVREWSSQEDRGGGTGGGGVQAGPSRSDC